MGQFNCKAAKTTEIEYLLFRVPNSRVANITSIVENKAIEGIELIDLSLGNGAISVQEKRQIIDDFISLHPADYFEIPIVIGQYRGFILSSNKESTIMPTLRKILINSDLKMGERVRIKIIPEQETI